MISIRTPQPLPEQPSQLLVLGERGVYCCLDTGQLRFMMKLEISPSCVCPYGVVPSTDTGGCILYQLQLYVHVAVVVRARDSLRKRRRKSVSYCSAMLKDEWLS